MARCRAWLLVILINHCIVQVPVREDFGVAVAGAECHRLWPGCSGTHLEAVLVGLMSVAICAELVSCMLVLLIPTCAATVTYRAILVCAVLFLRRPSAVCAGKSGALLHVLRASDRGRPVGSQTLRGQQQHLFTGAKQQQQQLQLGPAPAEGLVAIITDGQPFDMRSSQWPAGCDLYSRWWFCCTRFHVGGFCT